MEGSNEWPVYVALERYSKISKKSKEMDLIKVAEEAFATGKEFPKFKAGDTITVAYKIIAYPALSWCGD